MKLIIGLGNPGKEYQNNRHNVGFMALEKIFESPLLQEKRIPCALGAGMKPISMLAEGKPQSVTKYPVVLPQGILFPLISLKNPRWKKRLGAAIVEITKDKQKILLAAPQKFINNSGQVITDLLAYYNLKPSDILVLSDDLQIEFGTIRLRQSGGAGGHNGLASIIDQIGGDFWRIRIGIKNEFVKDPGDWHDFVLSDFIFEEKKKLPKILDSVVSLVIKWIYANKKIL